MMDCRTARVLLEFARPFVTELDAREAAALEQHLAGCPECQSAARIERQVEEQLRAAMQAVPVPAGIRQDLIARLRAERHVGWQKRWAMRGFAAAAAVLLAFWGLQAWLYPRTALDVDSIVMQEIMTPRSPEEAEARFREWGVRTVAPTQFNYRLLAFCELAEFQGKRTPHLVFYTQAPQGMLVARVYILSDREFDLRRFAEGGEFGGSGSFKVHVAPQPDSHLAYFILFNSEDLKPFQINDGQPAA
jgi:hypothetical protein